jgi:hypothetical protein
LFVCLFVCLFVWLMVLEPPRCLCLFVCLVDGFGAAEVFFRSFVCLFVCLFCCLRSAERPFLFVCSRAAEVFVCLLVCLLVGSFVYDPPSCSVTFFLCFWREFRLGRCLVARPRQDRERVVLWRTTGRLQVALQRVEL